MLAYWTHCIDPFIVKFPSTWPIEGIRWYGVAYFLSFLLAALILRQLYKNNRIKLDETLQQNYLLALFFGVLIGGRLGFVFLYHPSYYFEYPLEIFEIWKGGMSFHGGFIGVIISLLLFSRKYKLSLLSLYDLSVPLCTLGIFLGRCSNFINGEVYGTITTVPWAIIFNNEAFARHPSQLYEAFLEGGLLFIWSYCHVSKSKHITQTPGLLACRFIVLYSPIRCVLECFREPDASLIGILSRGQFYSIFTFLIGLILNHYVKNHKKTNSTCVFYR